MSLTEKRLKKILNNINFENAIIINQGEPYLKELKEYPIEIINSNTIGLSKSRNIALTKMNQIYSLLTDDDVIFVKDYSTIIEDSFHKNPDVDIITFKIKNENGNDFRKYRKKSFIYNRFSILKVSSIEFAIKTETIKKKRIFYNENFGLGAKYVSGEENLFLQNCLKKGLKAVYLPITIAEHSSFHSGSVLAINDLISKGALFVNLFPFSWIFVNFIFVLKKNRKIKVSFIKSIYNIYKGSISYLFSKIKKNQ